MVKTRVREGSFAHRFVKALDYIDDSNVGAMIGGCLMGIMFVGLAYYGMAQTHPF